MFKLKLVFLYENPNDALDCTWSYQWVDWDGIDEVSGILDEYHEKEAAALYKDNISKVVRHVLVVGSVNVEDGKYYCTKCNCYFDNDDDSQCPFCGAEVYEL